MPINFIAYIRIDQIIDLILEVQLLLGNEAHVIEPILIVLVFEADFAEFILLDGFIFARIVSEKLLCICLLDLFLLWRRSLIDISIVE
jgi:hypothetical protein